MGTWSIGRSGRQVLGKIAGMKSMRRSHIIVVANRAGCHGGERLSARLRRMAIGRVTTVTRAEEAQRLCRAVDVDACLVMIGDTVPDAVPAALAHAPGRSFGIPTLIVAPVVTPYLRKVARCGDYAAVLPANIAPRMLYRRIGALLQGRHRRRRPASPHLMVTAPAEMADFAKPTVH